jgi:hypothetical protein
VPFVGSTEASQSRDTSAVNSVDNGRAHQLRGVRANRPNRSSSPVSDLVAGLLAAGPGDHHTVQGGRHAEQAPSHRAVAYVTRGEELPIFIESEEPPIPSIMAWQAAAMRRSARETSPLPSGSMHPLAGRITRLARLAGANSSDTGEPTDGGLPTGAVAATVSDRNSARRRGELSQ